MKTDFDDIAIEIQSLSKKIREHLDHVKEYAETMMTQAEEQRRSDDARTLMLLLEHAAGIEMIEPIVTEIADRAIYLRGVLAGRIIHECSKND